MLHQNQIRNEHIMVAQVSAIYLDRSDADIMADDNIVDCHVFPGRRLIEMRLCVKCTIFAAVGNAIACLTEEIKLRNRISIEIAEENDIFLAVHDADQLFELLFSMNKEIRLE